MHDPLLAAAMTSLERRREVEAAVRHAAAWRRPSRLAAMARRVVRRAGPRHATQAWEATSDARA